MLRLGRILGIDVSLHWSLLLLIAFYGVTSGTAVLTAAVFGCVLLHELGHSMAARQFGINTDSIVLLPIGGIASLERMPRNPYQELWIAVAGPLVNVVIAAALYLSLPLIAAVAPSSQMWFVYLIGANIFLVLFNMLPAFPMDGGRVLRSILAMNMSYLSATQIAAKVGRMMAVLLGTVGLFYGHFMLMLVAVFVFFAGSAEARAVVAEQMQRDWRGTIASAFQGQTEYMSQRPGGINGDTFRVVWDESLRKYRYA